MFFVSRSVYCDCDVPFHHNLLLFSRWGVGQQLNPPLWFPFLIVSVLFSLFQPYRDSLILPLLCEGTSVFAGFAIFSMLGHMSVTLDIPIANFTQSGKHMHQKQMGSVVTHWDMDQTLKGKMCCKGIR